MAFRNETLPNGLDLVTEANDAAYSVAVGFFVKTGSRDETDELSGVSHFLEHMVFKGSERRRTFDVNREFDEIGAKYNAFTNEENTVFWAAVLPEYLPRAVDLLSDVLRPTLRGEDFEMEKQVILEEIGMYADQPMFNAYERCMQEHFGPHPLGHSVLGTIETIAALTRDQMQAFFDRRYRPENVICAAAGKFDYGELERLVETTAGRWSSGPVSRELGPASPTGRFRLITKDKVVQEHVVQLAAAPPAESEDRFAADVLSVIVGDDLGSRLYWELVDPGLADTAEMTYHEFSASGAFMTCLSCSPDRTADNLRRIVRLYRELIRTGVSDEELARAKSKIAARIVLASERPMGRLVPLGFNWAYRREYRTVDDDLHRYAAVTADDIRRLLAAYPLDRLTTVAVGPLAELQPPC